MSLSYDYGSPFLRAYLLSVDGFTRVPLWTRLGLSAADEDRLTKGLSSLAYLQEVTITNTLGEVPVITAKLTPPFQDARKLLDSPLFEWGTGAKVQVQFGYLGGATGVSALSPIFDGALQKPDIQIGADVSITLNGQAPGAIAAVASTGSTVMTGQRFNLIGRLALGADGARGMEVNLDDVPEGSAEDLLLRENISFTKGGQSDWYWLREMARQCSCWLVVTFVDGQEVLNVVSRNKSKTVAPSRTFYLFDYPGGRLDSSKGQYPILSVSSPTMAAYLPSFLQGLSMSDVSSEDKEAVKKDFNDSTVLPARGQEGATGPIADRARERAARAKQKQEAVDFVQSLQDTANRIGGVDIAAQKAAAAAAIAKKQSQNRAFQAANANAVVQSLDSSGGTTNFATSLKFKDTGIATTIDPVTRDGAGQYPGNPNNAVMSANAKSDFAEIQKGLGVSLTIQTLALPDINPGELIEVKGLGERLNGNYTIMKVTHTLGSAFNTSLECVRDQFNALFTQGSGQLLAAKGAVGPPRAESFQYGTDQSGTVALQNTNNSVRVREQNLDIAALGGR